MVTLPGEPGRYVRIWPKHAAGFQNTLSEVAAFDHPVSLPALPARSSENFFAALQRPGVVGVVSARTIPTRIARRIAARALAVEPAPARNRVQRHTLR